MTNDDVDEGTAAGPATFDELRELVRARGFYEPRGWRVAGELAFHVSLSLAGIAIVVSTPHLAVKAIGLVISTLGTLGVSTHSHTSSHYGSSKKRWVNQALTYFGYPFFLQVSAASWCHRHVVVHHPVPNVIGQDDDVDFLPWLAFTERDHEAAGRAARVFYRCQWFLFPLVLMINGFSTQITSWAFLLRRLADPARREARHWIDLATLLLHWVAWYFVPMAFFRPVAVIEFNVARIVLMGYAMFSAFAPAHWPEEARAIDAACPVDDKILVHTWGTINFRVSRFGRLLCSGVEYQIEHHLFPGVCHVHYPELSKIVRAFCLRNGYPYRALDWRVALWKSLLVMRFPKRIEPTLEKLPVADESERAPLELGAVTP